MVNYSCMYRHDLLVSKSWRTYLYEQWQVEWKEISYFKIYDLLKIPRVYTRIQLSECNPGLDLTALTILRISPRYSIPSALACSQFHCTTNVPLPSSYLQRTRVYPTYFLTSLSQFRVTHFQRNQPEITVEPARRRRSTKIFPTCFSPLNEWKKAWMLLTRRGILFVKKKKKKIYSVYIPLPNNSRCTILLDRKSSSRTGINPPVAAIPRFYFLFPPSVLPFILKILYMRGLGCREESVVRNWMSKWIPGWLGEGFDEI